jgi:hypothetical protein
MYRLSPLPPQSQSQQHRHYSQQQQSLSTLPRPASAALRQTRLKLETAEHSKGCSDRIAKLQATFDAAAAEHEENMRLTNQCLEDHRIAQAAAWAEQQQAAYEQFHPPRGISRRSNRPVSRSTRRHEASGSALAAWFLRAVHRIDDGDDASEQFTGAT